MRRSGRTFRTVIEAILHASKGNKSIMVFASHKEAFDAWQRASSLGGQPQRDGLIIRYGEGWIRFANINAPSEGIRAKIHPDHFVFEKMNENNIDAHRWVQTWLSRERDVK